MTAHVRRSEPSAAGRRRFVAVLVAVLAVLPPAARSAAGQERGGIAPALSARAAAQIEMLMAEKEARTATQKKIDSRLLHASRIALGRPLVNIPALRVSMPMASRNRVLLDVRATVTDALLVHLRALGADVAHWSARHNTIALRAPFAIVESIAALPEVAWVAPEHGAMTSRSISNPLTLVTGPPSVPQRVERKKIAHADTIAAMKRALEQRAREQQGVITNAGATTWQGDGAHRAAEARATFGISGAGVKIGVLSDGVNTLTGSQSRGEIGAVTVLAGQAGSGDEGTAMLEIVADLAPGAELFFATAFGGATRFADNIQLLRDAGCDIIVDDVLYFVETPFQDGQTYYSPTNGAIIAQAVKNVAASGALYFSSAGNSGRVDFGSSGTWEGDFVDGGAATLPLPAGRLHNFGSATFNTITQASGNRNSLFWSDPLGASGNDYDLYILNSTGTEVFDFSNSVQDGNDDPFEIVGEAFAGERLVILKKNSAAGRFLHLSTNRAVLQFQTGGEIHGHAATSAANTFGIAATPLRGGDGSTGPCPASGYCTSPFNATHDVEGFSSDGLRRTFFRADATPFTPGNFSSSGGLVLAKPDLTAGDGGNTSVTRFENFFGTSAAAPAAAAIAALVKSRNGTLSAAQISTALTSTAIDIDATGFDRNSGFGIVMAFQAVNAVPPPPANPSPVITRHPVGATVLTGHAIFFSANASGSPAPTPQWQVSVNGGMSWNDIAGATGPNLSFAARRADNGKQYRCVYTSPAGSTATNPAALFVRLRVRADLDNDRQSDLTVWRPDSGQWFWLKSRTAFGTTDIGAKQWGNSALGDVPLSADMDGDGIMDLVVWRAGTGEWYWLTSSTGYAYGSSRSQQWGSGTENDIPLPGDIDGDGKADLIVWRPSSGTWFALLSSTGYDPAFALSKQWGNAGLGDTPMLGDFDGDGLADLTVWRASTGTWHWLTSSSVYDYAVSGQRQWGNSGLGDIPLVADIDGDGVTDLMVWRASTGTFFWLTAVSGFDYAAAREKQWGSQAQSDVPMLGDMDGDDIADLIVWRPGSGTWFWLTAASGFSYASQQGQQWGATGDIPMIK